MKYRKWTLEQKQTEVRLFYASERRWNDTARKAGISDGLLRYWLASEDINPDKEYAGELRSRLKVKPRSRHVPKDPFLYGVEKASIKNPDELLRENKDLRKKLTCYDNVRIEFFNGILKTEALYAFFRKTKVKDRKISFRKLAERVMWFIPVYNNLRKKDSLGHMTPVAFREANSKGTYPILS